LVLHKVFIYWRRVGTFSTVAKLKEIVIGSLGEPCSTKSYKGQSCSNSFLKKLSTSASFLGPPQVMLRAYSGEGFGRV